MVWHGSARSGRVWLGRAAEAGFGVARRGVARQGAVLAVVAGRGVAGRG
jgi:hypothetical protein